MRVMGKRSSWTMLFIMTPVLLTSPAWHDLPVVLTRSFTMTLAPAGPQSSLSLHRTWKHTSVLPLRACRRLPVNITYGHRAVPGRTSGKVSNEIQEEGLASGARRDRRRKRLSERQDEKEEEREKLWMRRSGQGPGWCRREVNENGDGGHGGVDWEGEDINFEGRRGGSEPSRRRCRRWWTRRRHLRTVCSSLPRWPRTCWWGCAQSRRLSPRSSPSRSMI